MRHGVSERRQGGIDVCFRTLDDKRTLAAVNNDCTSCGFGTQSAILGVCIRLPPRSLVCPGASNKITTACTVAKLPLAARFTENMLPDIAVTTICSSSMRIRNGSVVG